MKMTTPAASRALVALLIVAVAVADDGSTLLEIKKSFRNVGNVLYDWAGDDYCSWRGVVCDNVTFAVAALNFSGLNLQGEISPAVGSLKSLVSIDLKSNGLSGQIPDEIGDCSSLRILDLSFNNLDGDIPFSMSKLKHLENLILKNNKLIGAIPSTLSQLPNLKILDLAQNALTGEIPRLIYWNEVLQYLGLRGNRLEGSLSPDMCQLTGLWYFDVKNNSLTGVIPDTIGNCTSFQVLSLQSNNFTGPIPSVIGLMQALAVLYMQGNQLSGRIPPELGNMSTLHYLELNDNQLTGPIPPELGKLTGLFDLNLANNHLEGPIPDNLSSCVNLNSFNAYGNKLNGTIPQSLRKLESMTYLNLSSNYLSGPIPIELSRINNLDTLDLSCNMITGPIPSAIGSLEHLLRLNLSKNGLVGFIPVEFGNLRSVMEIDLSSNHLGGLIPQELGMLQNLMLLKLENNNITGDVSSLMNCFSLNTLNVSYNNLAGVVPTDNNFSRFSPDSFLGNPGLCGYWLGSLCRSSSHQEKPPISKAAILGIAVGGLVILLMILVAVCWPHSPPVFKDESISKPVSVHPKLVILNMNMALHVYEDIMRMTENLSEKYIIGYGASSTVYKCVLKNCKPVAIKKLYSHYPQSLKEFETELETVGSIKHRNLVSLQGYSLSPIGNLLFYDYMENGSLWDVLHGDHQHETYHILSKTASNTVMETVDPDIGDTCKDLGEVKKVFQLALLCTKRQPSDRPTMHEVVRVLDCLVNPDPPAKPSHPTALPQPSVVPSYINEYVSLRGTSVLSCANSSSTSDAELFLKFGEAISQDTE
ncbi:hypothetical protein PR202_gb17582 [Eleusine coracana subsp. coracana]|uniref:Protein kinase domain-containing protein n=1 Tax=Eleusine coracana subsp. coracana TaxID=191504 RepID=A0AAV5F349_ELECO|nr:hypothetical protein PR202_gb17582 [Eleusine coracana subsp. coracana]